MGNNEGGHQRAAFTVSLAGKFKLHPVILRHVICWSYSVWCILSFVEFCYPYMNKMFSSPARDVVELTRGSVEFKLLAMAFELKALNMKMTFAVLPVFGLLFHGLIPDQALVLWGAALVGNVAFSTVAIWQWRRAIRQTTEVNLPKWRRINLVATSVAGLAWATGWFVLLPQNQGVELALLTAILVTVCSVSSNTMASQPLSMQAFLTLALAPAAGAILYHGGRAESLLSMCLICCLLALIVIGNRSARVLLDRLNAQDQSRRAVQEARAARELAESTSMAKSRFLANMSHELRSPLNAVIGAAQLLKAEGADADTQSQLVDAIQRSGKNLLGLIENILDISRIEAGEMQLSLADFHLPDCVDTAMATAALAARAKGLSLACIVDPGVPPWRHGDALRLRQILLNLLGNAVKFTPSGDVVLRVTRGSQEGDVHISVTDTGVGIPNESLPYIFEPFRQADDASSRRFGGSGLGLSIVHQLVVAMGGRIEVQSQASLGTSFELHLALPLVLNLPAPLAPLGMPIAYFEPHEPSAQALDALLKGLGCLGQRVRTGKELHRWLVELDEGVGSPWLLLASDNPQAQGVIEGAVDLVEPECVIGMTRGDALNKALPAQALKLPHNIVKPVLRAELVSRLGTQRRQPSSRPMTMSSRISVQGALDPVARVLVVEDDALNQLIVCRLLGHGGYEATAANDGAQALELLASQSFDLVLMDWQMPDMDGLEVTRRLRAGGAGPLGMAIPIVALTANAFAEDRVACLGAGMNDFLTKPVQSELLLATVRQWTGLGLPEPELPVHQHPAINRTEMRPPAFDASVMAALPMVADGSEPQYAQELMTMFMESLMQTLSDMEKAIATRDNVKLRRLVHTLKSSSATVGAVELAALADANEYRLRKGQEPAPELLQVMTQAVSRLRLSLPDDVSAAPSGLGQSS